MLDPINKGVGKRYRSTTLPLAFLLTLSCLRILRPKSLAHHAERSSISGGFPRTRRPAIVPARLRRLIEDLSICLRRKDRQVVRFCSSFSPHKILIVAQMQIRVQVHTFHITNDFELSPVQVCHTVMVTYDFDYLYGYRPCI